MTIARKFVSTGAIAVMSAALAGCMSSGGAGGPPPMRAAPTGVEGAWIDAEGIGLSTFSGGIFQTVATDTGQKLSNGSYVLTGPNAVEINGTSLIKQSRGEPSDVRFNCLLISTNQLNCTSAAGQRSVLTRRA